MEYTYINTSTNWFQLLLLCWIQSHSFFIWSTFPFFKKNEVSYPCKQNGANSTSTLLYFLVSFVEKKDKISKLGTWMKTQCREHSVWFCVHGCTYEMDGYHGLTWKWMRIFFLNKIKNRNNVQLKSTYWSIELLWSTITALPSNRNTNTH